MKKARLFAGDIFKNSISVVVVILLVSTLGIFAREVAPQYANPVIDSAGKTLSSAGGFISRIPGIAQVAEASTNPVTGVFSLIDSLTKNVGDLYSRVIEQGKKLSAQEEEIKRAREEAGKGLAGTEEELTSEIGKVEGGLLKRFTQAASSFLTGSLQATSAILDELTVKKKLTVGEKTTTLSPDTLSSSGSFTLAPDGDLFFYNTSNSLSQGGSLKLAGSLTLAGGITAGSGAVGIVDSSGRIPALSSTYFASLSGASLTGLNASELTSGNVSVARMPTGGGWGLTSAIGITGGNVGIGTTTPATLLNIAGGGTGANGALRIASPSGATYWEIGRDNVTTGDFTFSQGGTERLRITTGGNVGIGTTGPSYLLDVAGQGRFQNQLYIDNANIVMESNKSIIFDFDEGSPFYTIGYKTAGTNRLSLTANGTEGLIVDSAGKVGIGTTSPASTFSVSGASALDNTNGVTWTSLANFTDTRSALRIKLRSGTTDWLSVGQVSGGVGIQGVSTDGTTAKDISLNPFGGNVGIGTTGPTQLLDVRGIGLFRNNENAASANVLLLQNLDNTAVTLHGATLNFALTRTGATSIHSAGAITVGKEQEWTATGSTNDAFLALETTLDNVRGERVRIDSSGNVGIGTTGPGEKLEINGGMRLNTATAKPTCDSSKRGTFWVNQGAAGVKDNVEVCAKDAADAYSWRSIY